MTFLQQLLHSLPRDTTFYLGIAAILQIHTGIVSGFGIAKMLPACGITGFLQIHAVVDHIDHNLHMSLRLHRTTHHAKTHKRLVILGDKGRNDSVKWPFARRISIVVFRVERKHLATVLEAKAKAWYDHT